MVLNVWFHKMVVCMVLLTISRTEAVQRVPIHFEVPPEADTYTGIQPATFGIPFEKGQLRIGDGMQIVDSKGKTMPAQFEVTATWGPESTEVRWLLVDLLVQIRDGRAKDVFLEFGPKVGLEDSDPLTNPWTSLRRRWQFRCVTRENAFNGDYGTWNFGDIQWSWIGRLGYTTYRYWMNHGKGWSIVPWVLWLRSGEREYWENVEANSLVSILRGEQTYWRPFLHGEHAPCYSQEQANHYLVDQTTKYIWRPLSGDEQLFDLAKDPNECNNLALRPDHLNRLCLWRGRLIERLADRPEGFTDGERLIVGRDYPGIFPHIQQDR